MVMERCIMKYEETLHKKKARRFHTLDSWATKPNFKIILKLPPKAYVKTAHAVCESTKLFLDMERFHDTLDGKIGRFESRLHRLIRLI